MQLLSGSHHRRAREKFSFNDGMKEWSGRMKKCTLIQTTEARGHRCPAPSYAEAGTPSVIITHHREG